MSRSTPRLRNLAKRILAFEARTKGPLAAEKSAFRAIDRLRPQLVNLMGNGGVRALLLRSLALANVEVPWLRGTGVNVDASLEGWDISHAQLQPREFLEGKVVLLAQLLGLMITLIGEKLTLRLVQEAWPSTPIADLGIGSGGKHAKEK